VADKDQSFLISGTGDVVEPDDGIIAIGSGGPFALAAARALMHHTKLSAKQIAEESLKMSSDICIYTNDKIIVEEL
jgi:ATP-dependent HslUV protease subunit HslV